MRVGTRLGKAGDHLVNLLGRCVRTHDDEELGRACDSHRLSLVGDNRGHANLLHPADRRQAPRELLWGFRQYAATQEQGKAFFCIVDLHSITVAYDPDDLRERTLDLAAMLFATGLDPDRSTVFIQSHVAAHPEAAWLLGSATSFGELSRMTQFKDRAGAAGFRQRGMFTYPVPGRRHPPLPDRPGSDRRRPAPASRARGNVAERFNQRYGETFTIPEGVYPEIGARIMDLQEPGGRCRPPAARRRAVLGRA